VDEPGDELLAGAAFAPHEHRGAGGRDPPHLLEDAGQRGARAHESAILAQPEPQPLVLVRRAGELLRERLPRGEVVDGEAKRVADRHQEFEILGSRLAACGGALEVEQTDRPAAGTHRCGQGGTPSGGDVDRRRHQQRLVAPEHRRPESRRHDDGLRALGTARHRRE